MLAGHKQKVGYRYCHAFVGNVSGCKKKKVLITLPNWFSNEVPKMVLIQSLDFGVYLQYGCCGVFISQREREKKNCSGYRWICLWLIWPVRPRQNPRVVSQISDGRIGLLWAECQGMSWGAPLHYFKWCSTKWKVDKPTCWVYTRSLLTLYSLNWRQIISFISFPPQLPTGLLGERQLSLRCRMQLQRDCPWASDGSQAVTEPRTLPVPLQQGLLPGAPLGYAGHSRFAPLAEGLHHAVLLLGSPRLVVESCKTNPSLASLLSFCFTVFCGCD